MILTIRRFGIHELVRSEMTVVLPEGSTLKELIDICNMTDGEDLAQISQLQPLFIRQGTMITTDAVLYDGDMITLLTPLGGG